MASVRTSGGTGEGVPEEARELMKVAAARIAALAPPGAGPPAALAVPFLPGP